MAPKHKAHATSYELIPSRDYVSEHTLRSHDTSVLNTIAAWWLFPLHLMFCALLAAIVIVWLDGRKFHIGPPDNFFRASSGLYQTQVNALLSLALVCIRLIGGCCTTLLIWRIIYILLEKRGISLLEITRLDGWRVPVNPIGGPLRHMLWSTWALWAILLLWPPSFSSPLASSSVAWAPSTRIGKPTMQIQVQDMNRSADSHWLSRDDNRHLVVVSAAAMAAADPSYVSGGSGAGYTRRFFKGRLPVNSVVSAPAPYIDISLKWVNASDVPRNGSIGDPTYSDVNTNGFILESYGTIAILRDTAANNTVQIPTTPSIFTGKKHIWIRLETIHQGQRMGDGSNASIETPCLTTSPYFGDLPNVKQYRSLWGGSDSDNTWSAWVATDCYIVAEATITAGRQSATGCQVSSFDTSEQYATCPPTTKTPGVEEDWLTDLSLAFTSEVLKFTVMQNLTLPLLTNHSIDDYAIATLRLGYHASWNVLMKLLSNTTVSATYFSAESVVQAQINRPRLFGWFGMNATLFVSALLVYLAQFVTVIQTVRDPTLAALTMDMNEVTHSNSTTEGLCNAVTLSEKDKKLPRMMWDRYDHGKSPYRNASQREVTIQDYKTHHCHRRVVFVSRKHSQHATYLSQTLVNRPSQHRRISDYPNNE